MAEEYIWKSSIGHHIKSFLDTKRLSGYKYEDQKKAEDIAAQRMQLLAPLLANGLDPAKARQIKSAICEQTGLDYTQIFGSISLQWLRRIEA